MSVISVNGVSEQINDFYNFITRYPLLGLHHDVGKEIEKEICILSKKNITNQFWYRAKAPDGYRVLTPNDFLPPKPEDTREGRYNHYGLPVLYVSEDEKTCAAEISKDISSDILCWIQKIRINNANVIDLSDIETSSGSLQSPYIFASLIKTEALTMNNQQNRKYYKPEYKITRFISDLCRLNNIDGIIYPSAILMNKKAAKNLVLLNINSDLYELIDKPYVFTLK